MNNKIDRSEKESSEPDFKDGPRYYNRGIYLLPNLLTTGGLFAGFYAIVAAIKGNFEIAVMAIFAAMVLDSLDGRVARMTKTESEFGAQYDSLSDLISFGLAPALLCYEWALQGLGKLGWIAAFAYTAATALRLARFNVQHGQQDYRYFIGLPCPIAAGTVISFIWIAVDQNMSGSTCREVLLCLILLMSYLMVSKVRYYTFKDLNFSSKVPYLSGISIVGLFCFIAYDPPKVLALIFISYVLSGIISWFRSNHNILKRYFKKILFSRKM